MDMIKVLTVKNDKTVQMHFQKDSRLKLESVKFRKYANIHLYNT